MCDTKFSIYLYSVRLESVQCAGSHVVPWVFRGRCIQASVWYGFFLSACYQRCSTLFMFLSFSLFHCWEFGHLIRNCPKSSVNASSSDRLPSRA